MNRRRFIQGTATTALAAATGASLLAHGIRTHDLEQRTVRLPMGLNRPLRMVALGDIHFDPLYEEAYLAHISARITALQPDLVVYTGDFVTQHLSRMHDLAALLSRTVSRLGSFATLGNHDHWAGAGAVSAALEKEGIRVLRNASYPLPGEDDFFLTGLDSFWAGTPDPTILARTPATSRHILLVHEPDPFTRLDDPRIKLQISGHTHGGQIRAPLIGALVLPKLGRDYQEGLYARNDRLLYVNRGVGTLRPHIRIHCRPEITVFELS
jgi:predicted MPP superfamily phosphohydrolase